MNGSRGEESSVKKEWKRVGNKGYMHLSVLFIASVQHIGRCLEGKVANVIPLDDGGRWDVIMTRPWRSLRRGRLRIEVSNT